jgi:subtilase family serine protease
MIRKVCLVLLGIASIALLSTLQISATGNTWSAEWQSRPLITGRIDASNRVTLRGNTRPEATIPKNDVGPVWPDFKLEHMLLQLKRPPEAEQALNEYIEGLTDKSSPNYHKWLTATQLGAQFGVSDFDIELITNWLESHGITVNYVYPNHMVIDITGTAAQLREALRVEIHFLNVNGETHFANMNDPQIPEALAPAITGIVSMHDFRPRYLAKLHPDYTFGTCTEFGNCTYALVPGDIATIYNFNPLFSQGLSGQGQTMVVIEDSDPYNGTTDWNNFRAAFGLNAYSGSLTTTHPAPPNGTFQNCADPGILQSPTFTDFEVAVDVDYSTAVAPSAAIQVAACKDTATFGGLIAIQNLVNSASPPAVMSLSYGECEPANGSASNAAFNTAYQTAAAEGTSIFVAAGDEGAASCDPNATTATHGISVSGFASTPFNVAMGGTDFMDTDLGENSTYWSSSNTATYASALGYIPEIPWNDSCAGFLLASFEGQNPPYASGGFCNSDGTGFRTTGAGSGGPSGCATGAVSTSEVVSGTCAGWAKPSWQSGLLGNPNDGVRDIPDVSLFSSNGLWFHYLVICYSDTAGGGKACSGAPSGWAGAGGTSFAAPMMAGIQTLVNQRVGHTSGNPNPTYYAIAATEYGASGSTLCNSSSQPLPRRGVSSSCIFYDVTQGDIDVNCTPLSGVLRNCYRPSGTDGVLTTGTITTLTLTAGGSGYTSVPTCTISAPDNSTTVYNGGTAATQAKCTAAINSSTHVVSSVTLGTAGNGYATNAVCTLSGGGGSGATCVASAVGTSTYQAAFPATTGWDFATGIGTVNAYNLVFASNW